MRFSDNFEITVFNPIDTRLVLTKAEMKKIVGDTYDQSTGDHTMPDKYFALCSDDNLLYYFDYNAPVDSQTGKFRSLGIDLSAYYTSAEVDNKLSKKQDKLNAGDNIEIYTDPDTGKLMISSSGSSGGMTVEQFNNWVNTVLKPTYATKNDDVKPVSDALGELSEEVLEEISNIKENILEDEGKIDANTAGISTNAEAIEGLTTDLGELSEYVDELPTKNYVADEIEKAHPTWETIRGDDPKANEALKGVFDSYDGELTGVRSSISTHVNNNDIHVTSANKLAWYNKYDKPADGIPAVDLDAYVQESLALADSALQEHQSLAEYRKSADQDEIDNSKVDKVENYGLSKNDFTDDLRAKLEDIESGAEVNLINEILTDDDNIKVNVNERKATISGLASDVRVSTIEDMIPGEATKDNKLADKSFVNSSIATATATFRGTVNSKTELKQLQGDLNDYAFVEVKDTITQLVKQYDRYKYSNTATQETGNWAFEYTLNNSSFTSEQWQSINSGVTSTKLANYDSNIKDLQDNKVTKINGKSLVSDTEITKLAGVSSGANKVTVNAANSGKIEIDGAEKTIYTHPSGTSSSGFNKLTSDGLGHITGSTPVVANDITGLVKYSAGSGLKTTVEGVNNIFSTTYYGNISLQVSDWEEKTDGGEEPVVQYYYQTKSNIEGITENSNPILDVVTTKDDYATIDDIQRSWSYVFSAETGAGSITFYASDKPTVSLTVQAKCY